ncbi:MAG TPA: 2-hydroxycarboxylate transporter family protein, partial [Phenylobacterium sp.]|nr:2-hydroxycarboxylate transporter family protein [Phenylobacterium sp.]
MTTTSDEAEGEATPALLQRWWALMDLRIGVVPVPVAALVLLVAGAYVALGKAPSDILMNIAVLATGGFLCAEVGKRLPVLKHIGSAAILATFVP